MKKELIRPTKIYVKEVLNLVKNNLISGCANITGGGIKDNIKRTKEVDTIIQFIKKSERGII